MLTEFLAKVATRFAELSIVKVVLSFAILMAACMIVPFYDLMTHKATEARVEAERKTPFLRRLALQVTLGAVAGVIHMLVILDGSMSVFMSTAIFSTLCVFGYENLMVIHGLIIKKTIETADAVHLDPTKLPVVGQYTKKDDKSNEE